mgnify:FL=1
MELNRYHLIVYGLFLALVLVINALYFFQVFRYRLPGDAALTVLVIHILLIFLILGASSALII